MNVNEAREVLRKNADCSEKSLIYSLHERGKFSKKRFWEFYDFVITLAKDALENGKDIDTAERITYVYRWVLKLIVWHFDKNDDYVLKKFPKNYNAYIGRLDGALEAYFYGAFALESNFELKRPEKF